MEAGIVESMCFQGVAHGRLKPAYIYLYLYIYIYILHATISLQYECMLSWQMLQAYV